MSEMTWNTAIGRRTLQGAEAMLLAETISFLIEQSDIELDYMYFNDIPKEADIPVGHAVGVFATLNGSQKYTVLEEVVNALLVVEDEECPALNHINESAIDFLFSFMKEIIDTYYNYNSKLIDDQPLGKYISDAYNECFPPACSLGSKKRKRSYIDNDEMEKDESSEKGEIDEDDDYELKRPRNSSPKVLWEGAVEMLKHRILLMNEHYQTPSPMMSMERCIKMSIGVDYYDKNKENIIPISRAKERLKETCCKISKMYLNSIPTTVAMLRHP